MGIEGILQEGFITTNADKLINYMRTGSMWPMTFGLACCAIEMIHTGCSRYDLDRFGIIFRPSPRQADVMIVAGWVSVKMSPLLRRLYEQMPEPKYVIAMGGCAAGAGGSWKAVPPSPGGSPVGESASHCWFVSWRQT